MTNNAAAPTITGTSMPISAKVKKLKAGLKARTYDETGSSPEKITRTIIDNNGIKVGEYVKAGKEVVETSATPEVKEATKINKECVPTAPSQVAANLEQNDAKDVEKVSLKKTDMEKSYHAKFTDHYGNVLHEGVYPDMQKINEIRDRWNKYKVDHKLHLNVVNDNKQLVEKSAAPMMTNGANNPLQKAYLPKGKAYETTFKDKTGNVIHTGKYYSHDEINELREKFKNKNPKVSIKLTEEKGDK